MQIYGTWCWLGNEVLPEKFTTGKFPVEVTMEDIVSLSEKYDLAFMHFKQEQPSRKEKAKGAKPIPPELYLVLDELGGKFRCR